MPGSCDQWRGGEISVPLDAMRGMDKYVEREKERERERENEREKERKRKRERERKKYPQFNSGFELYSGLTLTLMKERGGGG